MPAARAGGSPNGSVSNRSEEGRGRRVSLTQFRVRRLWPVTFALARERGTIERTSRKPPVSLWYQVARGRLGFDRMIESVWLRVVVDQLAT